MVKRSDGTDLPILEEQESTNSDKPKQPIKYGELVILGRGMLLFQEDVNYYCEGVLTGVSKR
ncbi:hypothetical protein HHI36_000029 [Cryptolaemus montrouzieri]|uniref:Uncharacterized protein n=1 Tax=Cryptolaemus montrouzieri TaxID=559131 RepID=A0ABD2P4B4_9CUCU